MSLALLTLHDPNGLASAALLYAVHLEAHATRTIALDIPLEGAPVAVAGANAAAWVDAQQNLVADEWRNKLNRVALHVPAAGQALADTLRTALAHILIERDGAALRPGTRSYARSWIRDGAMMAEALVQLGHVAAARAYLQWYAPFQFKDGKVPCCVDARGSDPVPENDSHGEFIHLVYLVWRYSGDRALLENLWSHVDAATNYMDQLRASERTDANRVEGRGEFFGLMPASISHEGYSAKPMHSYWDDFWALTGYDDAIAIAQALGRGPDAERLRHARDEFRADLHASIRIAATRHAIGYIPGSAELGDFDATSTTIALSPGGEQQRLPADLLNQTFERYWQFFVARRDGTLTWKDYTPYEWRTVGTFVRLGWRERAWAAIEFFMHDRRPPEWNQWAEVVGRDAREARFVGDMPHGWVASDFVRSTLDLFAYERVADSALVLAAGVPADWLDGKGIAIEALRTPYGALSYTLRRERNRILLHVAAGLRIPPGGIAFAPPMANADPHAVRIDGKAVAADRVVRIAHVPADVVIELSATPQR